MTLIDDPGSAWSPPRPDPSSAKPPPPPPGYPGPPSGGSGPTPGQHRASALIAVLFVALVAAGAVAGLVVGRRSASSSGSTGATRPTAASSSPSASASGGSPDVAGIAASVDPAIVDINTTLGFENGRAAGTGIVIGASGEVLTNNHVIDGATSISATDVGNGKTYRASVVGYDVTHDLAVLHLAGASHLTTANLATSGVTVGDTVIALGNAGGTGGTPAVATGTVTRTAASITATDSAAGTSEPLTGLIQTNAALQPGDSGGPLVNVNGEVVGIDTAASSRFSFRGGGSESFAVPTSTALHVARQIEAGNASTTVHIGDTAFLGIQVDPESAPQGVVVAGVESGGPADSAGLAAGDVITSIDGDAVSAPSDLTAAIQQHRPGDRIAVGWTDQSGQSQTATVTLQRGPAR